VGPAALSNSIRTNKSKGISFFNPPSAERLIVFFLLAAGLLMTGCEKKPQPLTGVQVRAISREFVFAAKNSSNGQVQTGMFPERRPGAAPQRGPATAPPAQPPAPSPDLVYITLPHLEGGKTDADVLSAVLKELDRVAEVHKLARVEKPGAPGISRFDYFFAGQRTHTINIVTPLLTADESATNAGRHPKLAIIIDDLGYDRDAAELLFQIPFPLTVSVLPYLEHSTEIAEEAWRRGYQVMLHLPMESSAGEKAERVELKPGMSPDQAVRMLQGMLETVPQATGVNNHQGSLASGDTGLMDAIMPALRERGLFFVDSRTTSTSVAYLAAHRAGVPAASRDVFLDDTQDVAAIHHQLQLAVRDARMHGAAIAIGHPHPTTLQVLSEYLPELQRQGISLVFASQVVR
jgi:polysaccharide deacetylase 2 family uncharacterized protein YibQ